MKSKLTALFLLISNFSISNRYFAPYPEKNNISVNLTVESNNFQPLLFELTNQRCSANEIYVLTPEELKQLSQRHFNASFKAAGGDGKNFPDPQQLLQTMQSVDSYIDCLSLYFKTKDSDSLIIDSLHYSYGKYPTAKNIKKFNFDFSTLADKSPTSIIDSLLRTYANIKTKKK